MLASAAALPISEGNNAPKFVPSAYLDKNHNGFYDSPPDVQFATIQAAIDASVPGDTIMVGPGDFYEQLHVLNKTNINIVGSGSTTLYAIDPMSFSFSFDNVDYYAMFYVDGCSGINVTGMIFDGGMVLNTTGQLEPLGTANAAIAYISSSGDITANTIHGINDTANVLGGYVGIIATNSDGDPESVNIVGNVMYDNRLTEIRVNGVGMNATIYQNVLSGLWYHGTWTQTGVWIDGGAEALIQMNTITKYYFIDAANGLDSYGIFLDQASSTTVVRDNLVSTNDWGLYILDCPIGMPWPVPGPVRVFDNTFTSDYFGVVIEESTANLTHNSITLNVVGVDVITTSGGVTDVGLYRNDITNNYPAGVLIDYIITTQRGGQMTVVARMNNITGNTAGVSNPSTVNVDFIGNWWGSNTGPTHASNPGGVGDTITDHVLYRPYITLSGPTVTATPGSSSVTVDWTAATGNFGIPILGYRVYHGIGDTATQWGPDLGPGVFTATVTGLTPGTTYDFKVVAFNLYGEGNDSNIASAIPYTMPDPPVLNTLTPLLASLQIDWTAPVNTGYTTLTGFYVLYGTDPTPNLQFGGLYAPSTTSMIITGLTPGVRYNVSVLAVNAAGNSTMPTPLSAIPYTFSDPPVLNTAVANISKVILTWTSPVNTGFTDLVGYKVFYGIASPPTTQFGGVLSNTTLTVDVTGLTPGILYYFAVVAVNAAGDSVYSNILSATPYSFPTAPVLSTVTAGLDLATLVWTAPTSDGFSPLIGYKVFYGTTSNPTTLFGSVGPSILTVDVTGLAAGTKYNFTVLAFNLAGDGPRSNILNATPYNVPYPPTLDSAIAGSSLVTLTWTPGAFSGSVVTRFDLYFGSLAANTLFGSVSPATTNAAVTGLTPGVTYYFGVVAVNAIGPSPMSNTLTAMPYTVPGAPTLNSATAGNLNVTLVWTEPVSNGFTPITGYNIYMGTSSPAAILYANVGPGATTIDVTGLIAQQQYWFIVKAVNAAGESPASNELSATPYAVPDAPTLISAVAGINGVTITWAPNGDGGSTITAYHIYYGTSAPPTTGPAGVASTTTSLFIPIADPGVTYYFGVKAANAAGTSPFSNILPAMPYNVPSAPVLSSAIAGDGSVTLTWTAPSILNGTPLTGYKIFYGIANPPTLQYGGIISPLATSITVPGISAGTPYYFGVKAVNVAGDSVMSNVLSATPYTTPAAPTLDTSTAGVFKVSLAWTLPVDTGSTPLTGIDVWYGVGTPYLKFATLGPTATSVDVTGLVPGVAYTFAVSATNIAGDGPLSNVLSATPYNVPYPPAGVSATSASAEVRLSWSSPYDNGSAVLFYRIYRSTTSGAETLYATVGQMLYYDNGGNVTNGVTYYYKVSAVNAAGEGSRSSEVSATPVATAANNPQLLSATAGVGQVALVWQAPISPAGTISGYRVYYGTSNPPATLFAILPDTVTSITVTGLAAQTTYYFMIVAEVTGDPNTYSSNVLSATTYTVPDAPTLISAVAGDGIITVTWAAPANDGGRAISSYMLIWDLSSPPSTWGTVYGPTVFQVSLALNPGNTWYFGVKATNAAGTSAMSNVLGAMPYTTPGAPALVSATPGSSKVTLTWTAPVNTGYTTLTGYNVYFGTTTGPTDLYAAVGASVTSLDVTALTPGVQYYFLITAVNAAGEGMASNELSATPFTVPNAPTLVSLLPGINQILVTWTAPVDNGGSAITGFYLYYGTTAPPTNPTLLINPLLTEYAIGGLTPGVTYYIGIKAVNAAGNSVMSNVMSAVPYSAPSPPTMDSAVPGLSQVTLAWTPGADGGNPITGYNVYYGISSTPAALWGTFSDATLTTVVTGLTPGQLYYFAVTEATIAGESALSNVLSATPYTIPGAPVITSVVNDSLMVTVNWAAPAFDGGSPILGYKVFYGTSTTPDIQFGPMVGPGVFTLEVYGLTSGTVYYFAVYAVNVAGDSASSNVMSGTPITVPGVPTLLSATAGDREVILIWIAPVFTGGSPITAYEVYYGESLVVTLYDVYSATTFSAIVAGLTPGTLYYFAVEAVNFAGESGHSNVLSAIPYTVPDAPTLDSAVEGVNKVTLSWTAPASDGFSPITGYKIYYGTASTPDTLYALVDPSVFTLDVNYLTEMVQYWFAVVAVNAAGDSTMSNVLDATPYTTPSAPNLISATSGYLQVSLVWTEPISDGGRPLLGYKVFYGLTPWPTTQWDGLLDTTTFSVDVTGLIPGIRYYFGIVAVNIGGDGNMSNTRPATPYDMPGAPLLTSAMAGANEVTLTWNAPLSDGGRLVTAYRVYYGTTATPATLFGVFSEATFSTTVTSLTAGVTYYFAVSATNIAGEGPLSNVLSAVPYTVPSPPSLTSVEPGSSMVSLTWTAPTNNGGSPITGYKVFYGIASPPTTQFGGTLAEDVLDIYVTGLTPGTLYYFAVVAVNAAGDSGLSNIHSATPYTVPGAPGLTSATAGSSLVTLVWTAPSNGGSAITGYKVFYGTSSLPDIQFGGILGAGTLTVDVTGLTPGTLYYFGVKAVNAAGDSALSNVRSATPYTVPGAPGLTSATAGSSLVTLVWTAPSNGGSAITGYKVFYGTSSTPTTQFGPTLSSSTLTVDVTGLTPGTLYYFGVKAVNAAGDSVLSNVRSATPYTVPNAPTLDSAVAGSSKVTIAWTAPVNTGYTSLTGYKVFYGTSAIPTTLFGTFDASTLTVDVTGLTPGTLYYFGVKAVNAAGDSVLSNVRSATPYTIPGAPDLTSATAGSSQVTVAWTAPSSNGGSPITGYKVYYGITPTPSTFYEFVGSGTSIDTVTGLTPGVTYYFGVKAVNAAGDSVLSNVRSAVPYSQPSAPLNPGALPGNNSVDLFWDPPFTDGYSPVFEYKIYRGLNAVDLALIASTSEMTYVDDGLTNGVTYYYAITAVNAAGEGPLSDVVSAMPRGDPSAPILVSATPGSSLVSLAWTPPTQLNGSTLLGFYVYCGTSTGSMVRWGSMLGPEVRSVNVTGLAPGVRYFFAVSAQTSTVETEWSNMLNAIPYTVPSAPALNSATAGTGNVTLVWTAPSSNGGSAITGYRVYYGTSATPATLFGTFGASMNTVVVTSLTPGTLYYFGVKAVNAAGDSALSNVLSATPLGVPSAPTLINATAGMGTVMVTWEAPSSTGSSPITGYQVYFGLSSPDTAFGGVVGPSVRQLTVTELTPGTLYYFGVRAINSVGASDMSNVRSATPYSLPSAPELITAVAGSDWVSLTWTAPSSNGSGPLTGYLVYYGIASPPTTQFGTMLSPTTMSINVTGLTTGTLYYFGVKAVNGYGNGPLSNVLNATPVTVPPAPNGLTYTATSTQISLSWQEVSGATSYGIYRGSTQLTLVLIANSTSPAYVDINVLSGATFYYKVSARNAQGEGPKSPVLQVTVPAPSKVAITGIVTDAGGKPLSGITVKLEDGTTATTNATGGFTLMALPGNHTLTISGPGIETQSVLVTVGSGGTNIGSIATKAATDWTWLIIIIVIIVIGLIIVMFLMRGRGKKPAQAKAPEKK